MTEQPDQQNVSQRVDERVETLFGFDGDPVLQGALRAAREAGLPDIEVSPTQGRLLTLLCRAVGAKRVLEVGTLGGYSTICLARGVTPDGEVVTLELEPTHAQVANASIAAAGLSDICRVEVGPAIDTLQGMLKSCPAPFDLAFIDADKQGYPAYLDLCVRLLRPGGMLIADNVVRGGRVLDPPADDTAAQGAARFNELLAADDRLEATIVQTTGRKGHDGLAIAIRRG